jgi:hypothetical protein
VNLEPREGLGEGGAMQQRALGAGARLHVEQPALQGEHLPEALDVAAGERQHAEHGFRVAPLLPLAAAAGRRRLVFRRHRA